MGRKSITVKPSPDMSSFGIWLTSHMSQHNIAMVDLHREVGCSYSVINNWINGDTVPRIDNLIMLCEVISIYGGQSPLDLMSAAISTFESMVGAVRRYHKRHPSVKDDKGHEEMLDAYNLINCPRIWPNDPQDV